MTAGDNVRTWLVISLEPAILCHCDGNEQGNHAVHCSSVKADGCLVLPKLAPERGFWNPVSVVDPVDGQNPVRVGKWFIPVLGLIYLNWCEVDVHAPYRGYAVLASIGGYGLLPATLGGCRRAVRMLDLAS